MVDLNGTVVLPQGTEMVRPYDGLTETTWHYGYGKDQLDKLEEYYRNNVQRHIVSATWNEKANGWVVEHISMDGSTSS